jgi:hypothetical protein
MDALSLERNNFSMPIGGEYIQHLNNQFYNYYE